jgi:divalent metal cation (Fe/Co/Zn/Cd) transporter
MAEQSSARAGALADLITSVFLAGVGIFIFVNAYQMPRLEQRNVHPLTVPGFVPMMLGGVLVVLSLLLAYRSFRNTNSESMRELMALLRSREAARAAAGAGLVLLFVLVLIWAASALFIFAFIIVLEVFLDDEPPKLVRSLIWALLTASIASAAIYYLFAQIFLVRLP